MPAPKITSFGSWKSPITSSLIVAESISLGQFVLEGQTVYWSESRPAEAGRTAVVRRTADGQIADMLPAPFNARTRVHEYGGGAFCLAAGRLYFSNFDDQRLYSVVAPGDMPQPLTPATEFHYADAIFDNLRNRLICVREDHTGPGQEAVNTIVAVSLEEPDARQAVLLSGYDFYSSPRLSPDGQQLTWLAWNHPQMPWDGTELWLAELDAAGQVQNSRRVAGGPGESIFQPEWSPGGTLHFVSDRSGWWNLYRLQAGRAAALCPLEAEFGLPQWVFGLSCYGFISEHEILCSYSQHGSWHIATLDSGHLYAKQTPYSEVSSLKTGGGYAILSVGSPLHHGELVRLDQTTGSFETLRRSSHIQLDQGYLSTPQAIEFPTENNLNAYGLFYPPANRDFAAPTTERPPLLVLSHGGPTAATGSALNLAIQYWTSRGIAVLDVNYGGSTGYGRAYRQRLNGQWGVVDVDDCVNGAKYLAAQGLVDGSRMAISGGSAGGFTTLCALTFQHTFQAGASHFGVTDIEALAQDTHKFESRYMDSLIGPYPQQRELYRRRSPIYSTELLNCPVIFFQGLEDRVVPPSQTVKMFEAVRAKGLPAAYLPFEGEQHGFRRAENIQRSLDAELYFYSRIFGFELAEPVEPVLIENL